MAETVGLLNMKPYSFFPLILQKLIWVPTRLMLMIFGRVDIKGLENLVGLKRPVIFASNHSSEIDPFMVPACLPFWSRFSPLFYAVREKSFYEGNGWRKHLFGGSFIKACGGYGVQVGLKDYKKAMETHLDIIKRGHSFFIFPEGGITPDGVLQPGRGGIAYMAEKSGAPVIPVFISNVYGMNEQDFFGRKRKIGITFGKAIFQEEFKQNIKNVGDINVYKEEAGYIMKKIAELGDQN